MKRTRQERIRLGFIVTAMALFFIVAILRLGQFQIINASAYSETVERQSGGKVPIPAERGMIFDRYGRLVAQNVTRSSLYAHPDSRRELNRIATYLEDVFHLSSGQAVDNYRLRPNRFRWVKRHLDDRVARRIAGEAPHGLYLRDETTRQYPFGRVGKQILGFTNIDSKGLSGFELSFDSLLAGEKGWADIRRDGLRNTYRVKETALVKPVPGQSVVLTVDWQMQDIVEQELRQGVEKYNAESGMAVFLDCNNGDILSMAHYSPDEGDPDKPVKLRAITDQFEPGSAFKPFTAAALLDAGLVDFAESTYCEKGRWNTGRRILRDDKELEWLTFRRIIELSSNIGLGKWAIQMEGPDLLETYRRFGFERKPDCGLPGETAGQLAHVRVWSDYNVAAIAMGHSVAVSALQMAMAMAAIANGGELLKPHLWLGSVDNDGYVERTASRQVLGRATKKESADSLRSFLRGVVENGTGYPANSKFVAISGKTGTAEIPNLESGGYYKHRFMASFCGFFPADRPVIAGIVVLRDPHPITYGGHTSGKVFRSIAERYCVSNPDLFMVAERTCPERSHRLDITVQAPDLIGHDLQQAKLQADNREVKLRCAAAEGTVVWQFPPPDRLMIIGDEVLVAVAPADKEKSLMADLRGLTVRKATAFLNHVGIPFVVEGNGQVASQSLKPGEAIPVGAVCKLRCRPPKGGGSLSG